MGRSTTTTKTGGLTRQHRRGARHLLLVSRFRDELARGLGKNAAIERACARAGRTVLFSGITARGR